MIKRETLHKLRNQARQPDFVPTKQQYQTLLAASLELMDAIDGGNTAVNRGHEIQLGLADLRKVLHEILDNVPADVQPAVVEGEPLIRDIQKAVLIAELIDQMLAEKGPQWRQLWDWYQLRIAEEFDED